MGSHLYNILVDKEQHRIEALCGVAVVEVAGQVLKGQLVAVVREVDRDLPCHEKAVLGQSLQFQSRKSKPHHTLATCTVGGANACTCD